jgi:ABC-type transporter Mla MlaB component
MRRAHLRRAITRESAGMEPMRASARTAFPAAGRRRTSLLRVFAGSRGDTVAVVCEGELCLSTRDELWSVIERSLEGRPALLRLDLRGVSFADSRALWITIATASRCRRLGTQLEVLAGPALAHLIDLAASVSERSHDARAAVTGRRDDG